MSQKKRSVPFPFDLLVMQVKANDTPEPTCMFCQQEAVYVLNHFIRSFAHEPLASGMLDIDAIWREAIHRQVEGNYAPVLYQVVCLDCCIQLASIQLSRRRPIQFLLSMSSIVKRQKDIDLSLAIMCTVESFHDEGDLWAVNAPGTEVAGVIEHVKNLGKNTGKAEEPRKEESEEGWRERYQKRQRLLELRAQIIETDNSSRLFRQMYEDLDRKEQQQGKVQQLVRRITYSLFGRYLDAPEKEKMLGLVQSTQDLSERLQAEAQSLSKELEAEIAKAREEQ